MLTPRENALAILNGEQPDIYLDFMHTISVIPDPIAMKRPPADGKIYKDTWGVSQCFLPTAPGPHPVINDQNKVVKDIESWESVVKAPTYDGLDWAAAKEFAAGVDRSERFVTLMSSTGIFERIHFLMGMEDAFVNYLEYPEEMSALAKYIADWKIEGFYRTAEQLKVDAVFYQDDWGSKQNLFLPPDVWREIIKPQTQRISDAIHEIGALYIHHSDCICEPIVEDMVDLSFDAWQGVIPENNIVSIQERTNHKLPMIGGIDVPYCDRIEATEEEIRTHVRTAIDTYCPGGYFFPGMPSGACLHDWNNQITLDELDRYGRQWAQEHPIA